MSLALEKRVAHLESLVAQLVARHEVTTDDIITLQLGVDKVCEHLDIEIGLVTKTVTLEDLSIDAAALKVASKKR